MIANRYSNLSVRHPGILAAMILAQTTWQEVDALSRDAVVLIPTGSLEQHGPHLPLFTDSIVVTAVAEAVESRLPELVLLTPTLWLGASGHHLGFAGSLSNDFEPYMGTIESIVESLIPHGFAKFYALNGHGGNDEPNGMVMRRLKARYPGKTFGRSTYYDFLTEQGYAVLGGPSKTMRHADEAEASLVMYLRPELVRRDKIRDDGLQPDPPVKGVIHHFDEISEQGSLGYASFATPETGRALFEASVAAVTVELATIAHGYVLKGME